MKRSLHICTTVVFIALWTAACSSISIPSLEDPSCTEARDFARSFYSTHLDSEMKPSADSLEAKSAGLTASFSEKIRTQSHGEKDPFTLTENYPRAFKLGGCKSQEDGSVSLEVQLLWRDKDVSRQESINAILRKDDGRWLIDDISRQK